LYVSQSVSQLKYDSQNASDVQLMEQCFLCTFGHKSTIFSGAIKIRQRPLLVGRIIGGAPVDIEDFQYQVKL